MVLSCWVTYYVLRCFVSILVTNHMISYIKLSLKTVSASAKESYYSHQSHNDTISMKYKPYHKHSSLSTPIISYFRHQYFNIYMMMGETNGKSSPSNVATGNSNKNNKQVPSSQTGNQNNQSNIICTKCCKINKKSSILMSCDLCGKHYHKKCFSVLPRLTKQKYIDICSTCLTDILPFSNLYGNEFHECLLEFQVTPFDLDMAHT